MSESLQKKQSNIIQSQNPNIPFLSTLEVGMQNYPRYDFGQRIQGWIINDESDSVFSTPLNEEIEKKLDVIDSGKEKMKRYTNSNDYIRHVEEVLKD